MHPRIESREPGTPTPALSKEEKKRNRPSMGILSDTPFLCLTLTLRLPYDFPPIYQQFRYFVQEPL
jgi:hypothetical protein